MLGKPAADRIRIHNRLADSPTVRISAAGKSIDTTLPKTKAHKRKKIWGCNKQSGCDHENSPSLDNLARALFLSLALSLAESNNDNHCPLAFSEAPFIDLQTTRTNPRKNWNKNNNRRWDGFGHLWVVSNAAGDLWWWLAIVSHLVPTRQIGTRQVWESDQRATNPM